MSDITKKLLEKSFTDGYTTALSQLEVQILSVYAKKVLNIEKSEDFFNAKEEDRLKVLQETMQVGSVLSFIQKLKTIAKCVMEGKPVEELKAEQAEKTEPGIILQ